MPAATSPPAARTEKEEQLWIALKRHIMRERQRKKEEQEAEVEEERLRKEREAREKQDEMTLGETREQIKIYETKLEELKNEKKQLFLKLKKVLNEDDKNKKRQIHKEANDMFQNRPNNAPPQQQQRLVAANARQSFLPPRIPHEQQIGSKTGQAQMGGQNAHLKRNRSPSPPQNYYKSGNPQQYQHPPKLEEGRRGGEPNRVVLWNKRQQYPNNPGTLFLPNAPTNSPDTRQHHPIIFPSYGNINSPIRQNYMIAQSQQGNLQNASSQSKPDKNLPPGNVYHINLDPPNQSQQPPSQQQSQIIGQQQQQQQQTHKSISQAQVTMEKLSEQQQRGGPPGSGYHMELKHDDRKDIIRGGVGGPSSQPSQPHIPEGLVYTTSVRHLPLHSGVLSIPPSQGQQPNKPSGSITQGYANRLPNAQNLQQQQPGQVHYPPRHRY